MKASKFQLRLATTVLFATASCSAASSNEPGLEFSSGAADIFGSLEEMAPMGIAGIGGAFDGVGVDYRFEKDESEPRRVLLSSKEKLSEIIANSGHSEFEIEAIVLDDDDNATANNVEENSNVLLNSSVLRSINPQPNSSSSPPSSVFLHVAQVQMPITAQTTFHFRQGRTFDKAPIVDHTAMLASTSSERNVGVTTLLSVNLQNGRVNGLQRGNSGNVRKISLVDGDGTDLSSVGLQLRTARSVQSSRSFSCGVDHKGEGIDHDGLFERNRRLIDDDLHDWLHHRNDGNDRNHSNHGHDSSGLLGRIMKLEKQRGSRMLSPNNDANGNTGDSPYSFHINMVIDIDAEFIDKQGGAQQAIEYVNFIVSAANIIFENELDAHLNVVRVQETTILDGVTSLRDALRTMRTFYSRQPNNIDEYDEYAVNLRHALLGRDIGGGIAFIDTVCDSQWSVGLSSGLEGKIGDLDEDALYDVFMFSHEVGHSLGSDHTFEYETPVDTCQLNTCPPQLPIKNSATIMSYCNFCDGGLSNIAMSLGGVWNEVGPRGSLSSWIPAPELVGSLNTNPKRVSHKIWNTLNSKGECILPPPPTAPPTNAPTGKPTTAAPTTSPTPLPTPRPITSEPTAPPSPAPTSRPTTKPPTSLPTAMATTNVPTKSPTPPTPPPTKEPTNRPTIIHSPTAPPTPLPTSQPSTGTPTAQPTFTWATTLIEADSICTSNCFVSRGVMFDVGLKVDSDQEKILVTSISYEHTAPSIPGAKLEVYTSLTGSYIGREQRPSDWLKLATATISNESFAFDDILLNYPIPIEKGEKRGFYLHVVGAEGLLVVGKGGGFQWSDDTGADLYSGSAIVDTFGEALQDYYWAGKVGYKYVKK